MRIFLQATFLTGSVLALVAQCQEGTACEPVPPQNKPACSTGVVTTTTGPVCGLSVSVDGGPTVQSYQGISYGTGRCGTNRWTDSSAPPAWSDTFAATAPGPICPQSAAEAPPGAQQTEDCLNLNVWTPNADAQGRPVMVFIHGGAFDFGAGSNPLYNSSYAASLKDVVVVTFNYRLGALGFLASAQYGLQGNYGFHDQQLALRWVQDNIAAFGGDPSKVTLFGESAGAMSVGLHLTADYDPPLFQAAIMESNPYGSLYKTLGEAQQFGDDFLTDVMQQDCTTLSCLQDIGSLFFVRAENDPTLSEGGLTRFGLAGLLPWTPTVSSGGQPIDATIDIPVMLGTNQAEGLLFVYLANQKEPLTALTFGITLSFVFGSENLAKIQAEYPVQDDDYVSALSRIATDALFTCPNRKVALAADPSGDPSGVFVHQFRQVSDFNLWPNVPPCLDEVCHGEELPYVFHTASAAKGTFTPAEETLSEQMVAYWTNFAKTGDPNGAGLPSWPSFPSGHSYLYLESPPQTSVSDPFQASTCEFWEDLGIGIAWQRLLAQAEAPR